MTGCSWFNRANRVPANQDFGDKPDGEAFQRHSQQLAAAIRMHMHSDRTEYGLMRSRIPKYSRLLALLCAESWVVRYRGQMYRLIKVPADQGSFKLVDPLPPDWSTTHWNEHPHFEQLLKALLPDKSLEQAPPATLSRASSAHSDSGFSSAAPETGCAAEMELPCGASGELLVPRTPKVLLCHAPEDQACAKRIATALTQSGRVEAVLCDGVAWFEQCKQCDSCLVLLSDNFVQSYEVEGQFTFATDTGLHCVGVYTDRLRFDELMQAPITMNAHELAERLEGIACNIKM